MAEEENVSDTQEEVVTPPQMSPSPEPPKEEKPHYSKDENFLRLREAKEQLEKENRELKEAYQRQQSSDMEIGDDDIVEGKVVKKLYNELGELKKFKEVYEQEKAASIPDRLQNKFEDFNRVVTEENIEKLKHTEPEIYASITAGDDLYAKGVSAYKTLKALGIVKEDPYQQEKAQISQNHGRPVSAQAVKGQGGLADANIFAKGLTPELKKQLQKEMQEAIKAR